MDKTDTKFAPEVVDDSFELSGVENNEPEVCEKAPETAPHRLTFKHAVVLFSLTLLWLSAAGPVFFITASIGLFFVLKITLMISFCGERYWWAKFGCMARHGEYTFHCRYGAVQWCS